MPPAQTDELVIPPASRPFPTTPEGIDSVPQIEHVVIPVQGNRSFDDSFGLLGRADGSTTDGQGKPANAEPTAAGNDERPA